MVWAVISVVFITIFAAAVVWGITAGPFVTIADAFKAIGDSGGRFDLPALADGWVSAYFDMFLILIFGLILWGAWRILRREITRTGGGGL